MVGLFVKVEREGQPVVFKGPFEGLKNARNEAHLLGSGLSIYHGRLILNGDEYDTSELSYIETCE